MFETFKKKDGKNEITVDEIIEKYSDKNFLVITYKKNGDIEVFVGSERKESE